MNQETLMFALTAANSIALFALAIGQRQGKQEQVNVQWDDWRRAYGEHMKEADRVRIETLEALAEINRELGVLATEVHGVMGQNGMKSDVRDIKARLGRLEQRVLWPKMRPGTSRDEDDDAA